MNIELSESEQEYIDSYSYLTEPDETDSGMPNYSSEDISQCETLRREEDF